MQKRLLTACLAGSHGPLSNIMGSEAYLIHGLVHILRIELKQLKLTMSLPTKRNASAESRRARSLGLLLSANDSPVF